MLLIGLAAVMLAAGTVPVPAASPCVVVVRGADFGGTTLPVAVNALAYDAAQDLYYAVAGGRRLATITREGMLTEHGTVPDGVDGAYLGTITEEGWLLGNGRQLAVLHVPTLELRRRVALDRQLSIGDWDAWGGALYGLDTGGPGAARLARVDPGSGSVEFLERLPAVPGDGAYGGVVIDPDGTLHALHNPTGLIFHIPLAAPDDVTVTDAGLKAESSDAAACPRAPPQPSPSPSPSPIPQPPPPPPIPEPPEPEPEPEPEPSVESPIPTPSPIPEKVEMPTLREAKPVPPTRFFFLGVMIPAIVVAARSVARRR